MREGEALLPLAADHPSYAGHFPGKPILPGAVLLDEALHAIGRMTNRELAACRIASVKFLSPVQPGDPVSVRYEAQDSGAIRFDILSNGRKIATGTVRAHADE